MNQKEIKAKYMDIICKEVWDTPSMQKYASNEFGYGVELDNGEIVVLNKPRIEKDFCFGYGYCGVSTEEDEDRASAMAHKASTDTEYFIKKNMEPLNDKISRFKDKRYIPCKRIHYTGQPDDSKLKCIDFIHCFDEIPSKLTPLSESEIQAMITGYEELKKLFQKRLNTYLKRYGLSKLNVWTYLSD